MYGNPDTALIDADLLLYKFGFVNETEYDWGDVTSKTYDVDNAIKGINRFVKRIKRLTSTPNAILCLSSTNPNFRYDILSTYKQNRKDQNKPDMLHHLRYFMEQEYKTKSKPSLEADDVMGILATLKPEKYVICTIDKDLKTVPANYFNWDKSDEIKGISTEEANRFFFKQVLMGDSTDGYSGCPQIGDKRSDKILNAMDGDDDYWEVIVDTYESKGLTEEDALQQARVARILRAEDWDLENKEKLLWMPENYDNEEK